MEMVGPTLPIASGQAGLDGLTVPKNVAQEYQQEPGLLNKKLDMEEMNAMERKQKKQHVTLNHALFIASGQAGLDGLIVPKTVAQEYQQEPEEMNAMERKLKRKPVTFNHFLFIASGQAGLDGLTVPKNVAQGYHQEPELMNKRLDMEEMNAMETK